MLPCMATGHEVINFFLITSHPYAAVAIGHDGGDKLRPAVQRYLIRLNGGFARGFALLGVCRRRFHWGP